GQVQRRGPAPRKFSSTTGHVSARIDGEAAPAKGDLLDTLPASSSDTAGNSGPPPPSTVGSDGPSPGPAVGAGEAGPGDGTGVGSGSDGSGAGYGSVGSGLA